MIQKFFRDTAILLPDVPFKDRNLYTYQWYVDNVLVGEAYRVAFKFEGSRVYTVKLVTINKSNKLSSISVKSISAVIPNGSSGSCYIMDISFNGGGGDA